MVGAGYTTGSAIGSGKTNTDTIINFFETIYEVAAPHRSYYAYYWTGLTTGTVEFTDGTHIYELEYRNNGLVAAKICDEYVIDDSGVIYDDWHLPSKNE